MGTEPIAVNWPSLAEDVRSRRVGVVALIEEWAAKLDGEREEYLAIALGSTVEVFVELATVLGPDELSALLPPFEARLDAAASQVGQELAEGDPAGGLSLLEFMIVLECLGRRVPERLRALQLTWLSQIVAERDALSDEDARKLPFLAVALGAVDRVPELTNGRPLPTTSRPGAKLALDGEGFLRYLATAIVQRAPASDIGPAFEDFVRVFPIKLAANATDWTELLFGARGYFVHLARRPIGEVARELHETIFASPR